MHVLVTGHTGFKGAWLTLMLLARGHEVTGLALDPLPGSLFERADLGPLLRADVRGDIRNRESTAEVIVASVPDVVVHLAAQPLVRESYAHPHLTFDTNVMGTLAVLEGIAATPAVRAALMVTTDKVYRNTGKTSGYVESDALGGHDPYSASKAMADLMITSWVDSFGGPPTATARAGNVIGGGDVSPDRLLPDLMRGFAAGESVPLRFPDAVRPWQHVLDCLNGYLMLIDAMLAGAGVGAWNIGPDPAGFRTVREVAERAAADWGDGAHLREAEGSQPHEAALLTLDAGRARRELGWHDRLSVDDAVRWTVDWTRLVQGGASARDVTRRQIEAFDAADMVQS